MDRYYNNQRSQKGREQHILYIQGVPKKRTNKTNKNGQTSVDYLGPFWAHLDTFGPFRTKINLLSRKDKACEQKIIFRFKWSKSGIWNLDKPAVFGHFCLFYWCVFFGTPCISGTLFRKFHNFIFSVHCHG